MNDGSSGADGGPPDDREGADGPDGDRPSATAVDDATGFGLSMTIVIGVLLAFAYYGVVAVTEVGFGQAVPPPFYLLALALVFVVELSRRRAFDARGLVRAVGITAVFGTLVVLAIEGGAYLWERPEVALEEFAGVAVLAGSLVVAAVAYVVYLSAVEPA